MPKSFHKICFLDNEIISSEGDMVIGIIPNKLFPFAFKTRKRGSLYVHDGSEPRMCFVAMKEVKTCSNAVPAQMYLRQLDPLLKDDKSNVINFVALHMLDGNVPLKQFDPMNNTCSDGNANSASDMEPVKLL
jgi:hypothetical protein